MLPHLPRRVCAYLDDLRGTPMGRGVVLTSVVPLRSPLGLPSRLIIVT